MQFSSSCMDNFQLVKSDEEEELHRSVWPTTSGFGIYPSWLRTYEELYWIRLIAHLVHPESTAQLHRINLKRRPPWKALRRKGMANHLSCLEILA